MVGKAQLFYWPSLEHAIINIDDAFGLNLFSELLARLMCK